jgi:hypothetical protein
MTCGQKGHWQVGDLDLGLGFGGDAPFSGTRTCSPQKMQEAFSPAR